MSSCDPVSTRSNSLTANFLLRFLWPMHMLTEKHPKQYGPRKRLREKTLAGAVTAIFARPVGDAQHGYSARHQQHGHSNPMQWAQSRCGHKGLEALEKCYNCHRGLLRRLRVAVVMDYNSTTALRWKPFHVRVFWRRYCLWVHIYVKTARKHEKVSMSEPSSQLNNYGDTQ